MSDSVEIVKAFSDAGTDPNKLISLIVLCLFLLLGFVLLRLERSINKINADKITSDIKHEISASESRSMLAIMEHKNQIVKCFYDVGLLVNRRKRIRELSSKEDRKQDV